LRKQERQWPRLRWVLLAVGLLCAVASALNGYILFRLVSQLNSAGGTSPDAVLGIAVFFPKLLIQIVLATWAFAKAFHDWHGNVTRMLLLRLLDAQQREATNGNDAN
jgi:hypothetical protein